MVPVRARRDALPRLTERARRAACLLAPEGSGSVGVRTGRDAFAIPRLELGLYTAVVPLRYGAQRGIASSHRFRRPGGYRLLAERLPEGRARIQARPTVTSATPLLTRKRAALVLLTGRPVVRIDVRAAELLPRAHGRSDIRAASRHSARDPRRDAGNRQSGERGPDHAHRASPRHRLCESPREVVEEPLRTHLRRTLRPAAALRTGDLPRFLDGDAGAAGTELVLGRTALSTHRATRST